MAPVRSLVLAASAALLLAACSSGGSADPSGSSSPTGSASGAASTSSGPASPSPASTTVLAVLCDEAEPETVAAIESTLKPDFTVSRLADIRADDEAEHAVVGYVEGPGVAVLAVWTGTGLGLDGIAAADDAAAQVSTAPLSTPSGALADYAEQATPCYSTVFAPDSGDQKDDTKDKDKEKN